MVFSCGVVSGPCRVVPTLYVGSFRCGTTAATGPIHSCGPGGGAGQPAQQLLPSRPSRPPQVGPCGLDLLGQCAVHVWIYFLRV
jgi:hypothetical protein